MVRVASLTLALLLAGATAGCGNVDTTPPEAGAPSPAVDADEDGIPDAQDAVPCVAVRLLVANVGVDDAEISLNGEPVVLAGAFPTQDVIEVFLDVANGANSIEVAATLEGYEQIHVMVEPADKSTRLVDETITSASALTSAAFGFDVSAACSGY